MLKLFFSLFLFSLLSCSGEIQVCPGDDTPFVDVYFDFAPYLEDANSYRTNDCKNFLRKLPLQKEFADKYENLDKPYIEITMTHLCSGDGACFLTNVYKGKHLSDSPSLLSTYHRRIRMDLSSHQPTIDFVVFRSGCEGVCSSQCDGIEKPVYLDFPFGSAEGIIDQDPLTNRTACFFTVYPVFGNATISCCKDIALSNNTVK